MSEVTTAPRDATLDVAGEQIILMAERALYWPTATTLFVADAHFGKAATFRAGGIFVPRGTTSSALSRLDGALARTSATRLIFLGDLLHAREGRSPETLRLVAEWRAERGAGSGGPGGGDPHRA